MPRIWHEAIMKNHILVSLRMTAVLVVITCGLYPLAVFAIAQTAFHARANGSFVESGGRVVGSELIGQKFASDRFFHSRPSAAGNDGYDGTASGGTNLGPTSKKLLDAIAGRVRSFDVHRNVPADAVTSSGSGLDPHISPQNADAQAARVARANGLTKDAVEAMIHEHTEGRFLGLFGEPRVNVLLLNLDLLRSK
jgi:potassium-transporting ATPase KdpC subunit